MYRKKSFFRDGGQRPYINPQSDDYGNVCSSCTRKLNSTARYRDQTPDVCGANSSSRSNVNNILSDSRGCQNCDHHETDDIVVWSVSIERLLRKWKEQVLLRKVRYAILARRYEMLNYIIGIPSALCATASSTGIFYTFQTMESGEECNDPAWVLLVTGILGIVGVVLVTLSTFMNFQKSAEMYKTAGSAYERLYRHIDSVLMIPVSLRGEPIGIIKDIREAFDDISAQSPLLSGDEITCGLYTPLVAKPPAPSVQFSGDSDINDECMKTDVLQSMTLSPESCTTDITSHSRNENELENLNKLVMSSMLSISEDDTQSHTKTMPYQSPSLHTLDIDDRDSTLTTTTNTSSYQPEIYIDFDLDDEVFRLDSKT